MNYNYSKNSFNDKLDEIVKARYKTEKSNTDQKQYRAFYSAYREKYFSDDFDISANVRTWRSHSNNQLPKIEILIKLCSLLDCDINYFITEQTDFRKDSATAAETTGLRYESIEVLEKIKKSYIKPYIMDELLNHDDFEKLIRYIWEYAHSQNNKIIIHDTVGEKSSESYVGDAQKELMKYRVIEVFGRIIDDIFNSHRKEAICKKLNSILSEMRTNIESCIQGKNDEYTKRGLIKMVSSYLANIRELRPDYGLCKFSPEEIIDNFDSLKEKFM